jgi:PIN domain nuclease of toxin-antitoxin system
MFFGATIRGPGEDSWRAGMEIDVLGTVRTDPFDRLLIAQALWEEMTIVGANGRFDSYGVKRVW